MKVGPMPRWWRALQRLRLWYRREQWRDQVERAGGHRDGWDWY